MTPSAATPRLSMEQRFAFIERDVQSHAKTLTAHNENLAAINVERATDKVRDENLDDRLDRIEKAIDKIYGLGRWVLLAFGASFVTLFANFLFRGGLNL